MKHGIKLLFCLVLTVACLLSGCGVKEGFVPPDKNLDEMTPNERQCAEFVEQIRDCEGLAAQLLDAENPGIMAEVMKTLTYEILSTEEQSDGSVLCTLEITAIDMEAMLESVSDEADSEEAALEEMLAMVPTAERSVHTVSMTLVPNGSGGYDLQYGNDVVNAVTGGMLNLIMEAYEIESEVAE